MLSQISEPVTAFRPIHQRFAEIAALKPDAVAVVCRRGHLSFRELECRAASLAVRLAQHDIRVESRVALCMGRTSDMIVAMLATLKLGAAYVPLDPNYPQERLNFMIADSGAQVIVTETEFLGRFKDENTPILCLDPALLRASVQDAAETTASLHPKNLAWIIYTSGSTGRPKGVGIEQGAAIALVDWSAQVFSSRELSGMLASTSWCFDLSAFEIWASLLLGGAAFIVDNAMELASAPYRDQVRLVNSVPVAVDELVRSNGLPGSVETVNLAGEPLPRDLVDRLYARPSVHRVLNLYGPTEDTTYSTWAEISRTGRSAPEIGVAIAGSSTYVLDESGCEVRAGTAGELYLGGAGLARGYIGRAAETAEKFVPNSFEQRRGERMYRTGDLVKRLEDGNLVFIGRVDHQVKIRGLRIELGEIEAALKKHPLVQSAIVTAQERNGDKRLIGYVVIQPGVDIPERFSLELQDFLRGGLPLFMVPGAIVPLEKWPLTPNGKVDRKLLPAPPSISGSGACFREPRTPVERQVSEIWRDVLKIPEISVDANFYHLGGHSLAAARILSRVHNVFGVQLSLQAALEAASIERLSSLIEDELRVGTEKHAALEVSYAAAVLPEDGPAPLSDFQQRIWLSQEVSAGSAAFNVFTPVLWRGPISFAAAAQAFTEVTRRHSILRSRFFSSPEAPLQRIVRSAPLQLPVADLTRLDHDAKAAELTRLASAEGRRPFCLQSEPPIRIHLVRLEENSHALLVTTHHIATDGQSIEILFREFSVLYRAMTAGHPSPLPEPELQYSQFAVFHRAWATGNRLDHQRRYWQSQLKGAPRASGLPTDHPRPSSLSLRGAYHTFVVSPELSQRYLELGVSESLTPFMVTLTALTALLYRLSGELDWVIGTDTANRTLPLTESAFGPFVNALALRSRISPGMTFRKLLRQVRQTSLDAFANQDLPFDQVTKLVGRDHIASPLFQVFMVLEHEPAKPLDIPGVELSEMAFDNVTSLRELSLYGRLMGHQLQFALNYRTSLFEALTIRRWSNNLVALMESAVRNPDSSLEDLSLVSAVSTGAARRTTPASFRTAKPRVVSL